MITIAEIQWIKLSTDLFNNRKIKQIRKLPEGDAIIGIWLQLLCLAGNVNNGGLIYFSQDVPYTEEMLASEFDRPIIIIRLALATFVNFHMVEIINNVLCVSNWEKYQNIEKLEQLKEKARIRQQKYRESQKLLISGDVTVTSLSHLGYISNSYSPSISLKDSFTAFWEAYPKKKAKGDAEKAWGKIKPNQELLDKILYAITEQSKTEDWQKEKGQFIPYPATWLNKKRWEDEIDKCDSASSRGEEKAQYGINL